MRTRRIRTIATLAAGMAAGWAILASAQSNNLPPKVVRVIPGPTPTTRTVIEQPFGEIDTPALEVLMQCGVKLAILDARPSAVEDGKRIPGARALSPDATPEQIAAAIESKDTVIVTYTTGIAHPEAHRLAVRLRNLGYRFILEYPYGLEGWIGLGGKLTTEPPKKP